MRQSFERQNPQQPTEAEASDFDLREYLALLRRYWQLLAIGALIGLALGLADYYNTDPVYQATTRIQIQRRTLSPLGSPSFWMETWWQTEFYPTQREILRSRGLAKEVVEYLRLWEDPRFGGELDRASSQTRAGDGAVTAGQDEAVIGQLAQRVRSGLDVREVRGTELVDIVYRARDPEVAQLLANAYAETFIEYGKESRRDDAKSVQGSIDLEIQRLELAIAEKDGKLLEFRQQSDIVETKPESNVTQQRLEAANLAYLDAQQRKIQAQAAYNEALERPPESIAGSVSSGVAALRSELNTKQREYQTMLETYQPEYPGMRDRAQEIAQLQKQLDKLIDESAQQVIAEKRADYQAAVQAERSTLAFYRQMEGDLRRLESTSSTYNSLFSELQLDRELLESLRRSQGQTSVAANSSDRSTIVPIDTALLPTSPISPHLKRSAGIGLLLGVLVAVGLVFLRELLDRTIKTPDEIEKRLRLPVLAVIPDLSAKGQRYGYGYGYGHFAHYYGQKRQHRRSRARKGEEKSVDLIPHIEPRLPVSEAYRALRTSLLLSKANGLHSVVVASATASEGKTATAANLAIVMAQLGRRTLLIDADLRRPRVHKVFSISNRTGLVSYLVGLSEVEAVVTTTVVDNLSVMPAGPIPPNPSELLSSARMAALLEDARSKFDLVVIDTPPALAVTDATLIANIADGLVLCVRAGKVTREDARACRDRLDLAGVTILGTVLNGYRPSGGGRYQSAYAYLYQSTEDADEEARADDAA